MPKKRLASLIWTAGAIVLGNALLAFAVEAFIVPHGIIMGGTTGLALVLDGIVPIDRATLVLILNGALLVAGGLILGWKLMTTTVASSLLYPVFLGFLERIPGVAELTDDVLMASLFGGVLIGVSLGMVLRVGSSTGGMDIASLILHKWTHIPLSFCVYLMDVLVIGGQALFAGSAEPVLCGLVVLVLESVLLDKVMILGQAQIQLLVISQRYDEIRRLFLKSLQAGVTMIEIQTGALGERQQGVLCVIPHRKLFAAKELIQSVDPAAFITITQVREVRGRGFTLERTFLLPEDEKKPDM